MSEGGDARGIVVPIWRGHVKEVLLHEGLAQRGSSPGGLDVGRKMIFNLGIITQCNKTTWSR
jgi:hypothetical protein